jgi:hypothetical protein
MLQKTCHRILPYSLILKPYNLRAVQKHTSRDQQLSLQCAAHVLTKFSKKIISYVVLSSLMRQNFTYPEVQIGITVSFRAVNLPQNV